MHGVAPFIIRKPRHGFIVGPSGCGIGIAKKLYIAAKGKRRDLPAGSAPVDPACQARPEAERKHLGMNSRPAPDYIMPVFMHGHDDRQGDDENAGGIKEVAGRLQKVGKFQNSDPVFACNHVARRPARLAVHVENDIEA